MLSGGPAVADLSVRIKTHKGMHVVPAVGTDARQEKLLADTLILVTEGHIFITCCSFHRQGILAFGLCEG